MATCTTHCWHVQTGSYTTQPGAGYDSICCHCGQHKSAVNMDDGHGPFKPKPYAPGIAPWNPYGPRWGTYAHPAPTPYTVDTYLDNGSKVRAR